MPSGARLTDRNGRRLPLGLVASDSTTVLTLIGELRLHLYQVNLYTELKKRKKKKIR